ncbi:MAG: hypothetical protein ACREIY_08425 [Candidatus Rokuibacteriota bacterium]
MSDRESRRLKLLEALRADAVRKFGTARAEALTPALELAAGHLADVAVFPLDREEGPAYYTGPGER